MYCQHVHMITFVFWGNEFIYVYMYTCYVNYLPDLVVCVMGGKNVVSHAKLNFIRF